MSQYHSTGRRSTKWWKRVFFYIVESAILNSYIMEAHVRPASAQRFSQEGLPGLST